jgi:peptidoglycan/xylan/chitin deacetylase (PgdA/CDA1 family)
MSPLRWSLSLLSPPGPRGRLSILVFHRVLEHPDPLFHDTPDAASFEAQMRWVRNWCNVLPLAQAVQRLHDGTIPPRALAITFDDGYADNEAVAARVLNRLGMSATFFVTTGYVDGGVMWNDRVGEALRRCTADAVDLRELGLRHYPLATLDERRQSVIRLILDVKHADPERRQALVDGIVAACGGREPPSPMMSAAQVRNLRALGMDVGAHTVTHPILTRLDPASARSEIERSKAWLETLLDHPVPLFAYPNGHPNHDYAAEHVQMVRDCGFDAAVTTAPGAASIRSDRFQLPRIAPWDRTPLRYGARLLANFRVAEEVAA